MEAAEYKIHNGLLDYSVDWFLFSLHYLYLAHEIFCSIKIGPFIDVSYVSDDWFHGNTPKLAIKVIRSQRLYKLASV